MYAYFIDPLIDQNSIKVRFSSETLSQTFPNMLDTVDNVRVRCSTNLQKCV